MPLISCHTIQALPSLLFRSNHSFVKDEPQSGLLRFVNFEFPEWESFRFGSTFFLFPRQNEKVLRPCFFESYVTNFADEKISAAHHSVPQHHLYRSYFFICRKIFFSSLSVSFALFFVSPTRANILYMPVFPVFLMGDVFPFPHVLWVFLRKKLFERFGCKEKRSTFVTAKAIDDRLTEDEGVFPTSGSGGSLTGRTAKRLLYSKSGEKRRLILLIRKKVLLLHPLSAA
ncbi:hypothetical protein [Porphyromonas gulae]|nr:hypothetical protein [Porphyromonas gulae]